MELQVMKLCGVKGTLEGVFEIFVRIDSIPSKREIKMSAISVSIQEKIDERGVISAVKLLRKTEGFRDRDGGNIK